MSAKRLLSPGDPDEGSAKRNKFRDTTDQDLEHHWQLLDAVRPIFSSDLLLTELPWTSPKPYERDGTSQFKIETLVRDFTIEMALLMSSGPPGGPLEDQGEYRQYLEALLDILHTLVKESILEAPMAVPLDYVDGDEQTVRSSNEEQNEPWNVDQGDCEQILDHDQRKSGYFSSRASSKSKTIPSFTSPGGTYPRLKRLARLMGEHANQRDRLFQYIETKHEIQDLIELVDRATELNSLLDSIAEVSSGCTSNALTEPTISPTRWKNYEASAASDSLYQTLSKKLRDCPNTDHQHEVKLQLNGFELDNWESSSSLNVRILVFTKLRDRKWTQHQCTPLDRPPKRATGFTMMTRLCTSLLKVAMNRETLNIFFVNSSLYSRMSEDLLGRDINLPTITLSDLLKQDLFKPTKQRGAFSPDDKAVLTLSLGRCLLHLFGTPWAQKWLASDVHFLRRGHEEILNIYHPYLICPLTRAGTKDCGPVSSHRPLFLSFAKLLLEIETGHLIRKRKEEELLEESSDELNEESWDELDEYACDELEEILCDTLEEIEFEYARENYGAAVRGCLTFKGLFARELRGANCQTEKDYLTVARKCLYDSIIEKLERNFSLIARPRQQESLQPRNLLIPQRQTDPRPFPGAEPVYVKRTLLPRDNFFFDAHSTGMDRHASCAENYFRLFDSFRKDHILPTLAEGKRSHERVKVAILDTGIDLKAPSIRGLLSKTHIQGHARESRERVKVKDYTKAGSGDGADRCGHGTEMAYLFMRVAPEADLYIYKISEGMTDNDPEDIAAAIYDAINHGVDIISMSFGFKKKPPKVEEAIDHAFTTVHKGDRKTILFAAASNNGFNAPITFPASDKRVIGVYALDGSGYASSSINTAGGGRNDNLGTLGLGIRLLWGGKWNYKSGTSYATPIAAGIAANMLEWLSSVHSKRMLKPKHFRHLRRPDTIREIMAKRMAPIPNNVGDVLFVAPWHLWKERGVDESWEEKAKDVTGILRNDFCQQIQA